jgi:molybdate transport system substrate-binding protein
MAGKITMMSGLALRGALENVVLPAFEKETGIKVEVRWDPTTVVMQELAKGVKTDIVILTDKAIDELKQKNAIVASSATPLAQAVLGLAVRRGEPKPDISTTEKFSKALVDARSVAYSRAGASGIYLEKLIERFGVADQVRAKATVIPAGFTAEQLVNGKADLAVQQISELIVVDGIEVVGPFPPEVQSATPFIAAITKDSGQADAAARLIKAMATPEAQKAYEDSGLVL